MGDAGVRAYFVSKRGAARVQQTSCCGVAVDFASVAGDPGSHENAAAKARNTKQMGAKTGNVRPKTIIVMHSQAGLNDPSLKI